ncbi:DUF1911 domain-containing protein [Apibacter muscae]|uniref:PoNe immunity protein domain-containing protein n=1 Tax=Apibacter muscae TaxID=2509004 RepID=UPI0011ACABF8|nr:PoNe immunity protein domain-containing protein [Apibacter muscae]TWP23052.1 DUF1911 domain-containing protein [Apibacter muscae]
MPEVVWGDGLVAGLNRNINLKQKKHMGLLDRFFGSGSNKEKKKIRAQFKNEKYFKKEIKRCDEWMNNDKEDFEKYIKKHGKLMDIHYVNACKIRLQKIENMYSVGESPVKLKDSYKEVLDYFLKGYSENYKDNLLALEIVSFCKLLNFNQKELNKIIDFINKWENNSKIKDIYKPCSLLYYLLDKEVIKRKSYKPIEELYQITQQPKSEAEISIKKYLDNWYSMHKDEPWYNSHLRDSGYSGYWAWEVAAVVKVKGLDDTGFKDNPYYPYDMVHWEDKK